MNTIAQRCILVLAAFIALALAGRAYAAETEAVVNPLKRQEVLNQAKNLMVAKSLPTVGKDPFNSEVYVESRAGTAHGQEGQMPTGTPAPTPAGPRSARDLIQTIAASLNPSGFFVLGGQPTLVFGQKRVKAGGFLTITFEGTEYTIEIISIERPNFTLRLNREEFTRPIK